MKSYLYMCMIFIYIPSLFAQTFPIVQVDPVINLSDEVWLDAVCDAATDNVLFTLKFLGQFEVMSDSVAENGTEKLIDSEVIDQETFNTSSLKNRAEAEGYDNILFGSCTIEDGSYVITMNAYDLALDKITYSGSTVVESIFDTFEAVDEITYQTVEGFSGIHVTYGSLVLVPPGTGEPFSFTIDGIALSEGTFSVDRMPAGMHKLAVRQERPFGLYEAVHEIVVVEEKENRIEIFLPDIVGEEISVFNRADRYLAIVSLGEKAAAVRALDNLNGLLGTSFFQEFRPGLIQKYESRVSILDGNIYSTNGKNEFNVSLIKRSVLFSEKNRSISNIGRSLSSQFDITIDKEQGEYLNVLVPDIKTITIDGNDDDWSQVSQSISDPSGDMDTSKSGFDEGYDLVEVKFAIDAEYLYLMMRSSGGKYRKDNLVQKIHIYGNGHLCIDFWLMEEKKVYAQILDTDTKNGFVNSMSSKIKVKTGTVFEAAIPLKELIKNPTYIEKMEMNVHLVYVPPGTEDHNTIDRLIKYPYVILPLVEAMIQR